MPRRSISEMAKDRYGDDEVAAAVCKDAEAAGTTVKIESGELTLPSEQDAAHWHERGKQAQKDREVKSAQDSRIEELERRLNDLMGAEGGV